VEARIGALLLAAVIVPGCGEQPSGDDKSTPSTVASAHGDASERGREVYDLFCASCHAAGEGRAGTLRLKERLGPDKAVLVERTDLQPEYIKGVVRQGIMLMPPFRPSEIPDADLEALAAFLGAKDQG
jgi:mono/diheme cytochrome c family protein